MATLLQRYAAAEVEPVEDVAEVEAPTEGAQAEGSWTWWEQGAERVALGRSGSLGSITVTLQRGGELPDFLSLKEQRGRTTTASGQGVEYDQFRFHILDALQYAVEHASSDHELELIAWRFLGTRPDERTLRLMGHEIQARKLKIPLALPVSLEEVERVDLGAKARRGVLEAALASRRGAAEKARAAAEARKRAGRVHKCLAPGDLLGSLAGSAFGSIAERFIERDYCSQMGCDLMKTDYFDNPVTSSYVAFLIAMNPRLDTRADKTALAIEAVNGLNRPDILTHKEGHKQYYEIKPNSKTGRAAGADKLANLAGFMEAWNLPYKEGTKYTPTARIPISSGQFAGHSIDLVLSVQRTRPGLVVYDLCLEGERDAVNSILLVEGALSAILGTILSG